MDHDVWLVFHIDKNAEIELQNLKALEELRVACYLKQLCDGPTDGPTDRRTDGPKSGL